MSSKKKERNVSENRPSNTGSEIDLLTDQYKLYLMYFQVKEQTAIAVFLVNASLFSILIGMNTAPAIIRSFHASSILILYFLGAGVMHFILRATLRSRETAEMNISAIVAWRASLVRGDNLAHWNETITYPNRALNVVDRFLFPLTSLVTPPDGYSDWPFDQFPERYKLYLTNESNRRNRKRFPNAFNASLSFGSLFLLLLGAASLWQLTQWPIDACFRGLPSHPVK